MKHVTLVVSVFALSWVAGCGSGVPNSGGGTGVFCGGIAGIACPGEGRCVDDPTDDCNPDKGGADCSGVCECVETVLCVQGSHFDASPKVCSCVPDACVETVLCAKGSHFDSDPKICACVPDDGAPCGQTTCGAGTYCCNASCGICVRPGVSCIQIACD